MSNKNSHADLVLIRPNGKSIMYHGVRKGAVAVDPPYWLAVMGGFLRDKGIDVALIDAEAAGQTPEETANEVMALQPKLVGVFTLGSNLTASTWTMPGASILCNTLKEAAPNIPLFLWGNHPSALPERTLREEMVDYVIVGEGFDTVEQLYHFCAADKPLRSGISGLQYLENNTLCGDGRPSVIHNLNALPIDGWDLFPSDQRRYRNHMHFAFEDLSKRDRYGAILSSLGCPYSCTYCAVRTFSGNTRQVRFKNVDVALKEIDWWVKNRDVFYLRILDECFTINRNFAMEFSKKLKERGYDLSIWIYARIDTVDEELLSVMREAGIKWLGYGIESAKKKVRKAAGKGQYDFELTKKIVTLTQNCDQSISGNLMFGLPGETIEDMKNDLAAFRDLNIEYPNIYCTMAYPGSQLYEETLRNNPEWLPDNWAGYAQLSYETQPLPTTHLTSAEILRFRDFAFEEYFRDNEKYFNMIHTKFGQPAVDAIQDILKGKLKRKILGD